VCVWTWSLLLLSVQCVVKRACAFIRKRLFANYITCFVECSREDLNSKQIRWNSQNPFLVFSWTCSAVGCSDKRWLRYPSSCWPKPNLHLAQIRTIDKEIRLRYLEVVQLSCIFGFICSIGAILVREKRNNQEQKTSNRGNPRELGKSQRISTSKDTSQKPTRR
jgi:hypothetical protein